MDNPAPFAPFIVRRLWSEQVYSVSGRRAHLVTPARILYAVVRDIVDGRIALHAASLVYTTILSLVPLIALAFSVLKGFGVHYRFEPLLMSGLAPLGRDGPVIADSLLQFVDKMDVGVLGTVGLAMLFYTAISVVQKVEAAFNEIWHAGSERPLFRKFTDYLSVFLIGPVLMFSAFGVAASVMASEPIRQLSQIRALGVALEWAVSLVPVMLVILMLTFLYKFLPYTLVNVRSALIGGLCAGLLWAVAGWAFAMFVQSAGSYTAIYSAFAALILFFIWLDLNWMILLLGSAIAFYHQHPEYMPIGPGKVILSIRSRERLALSIVQTIGKALYAGQRPPTTESLRRQVGAPQETVQRVLDALASGGMVAATSDQPPRWVPSRALDATPLKLLFDTVRAAGEQDGLDLRRIPADPSVVDAEARVDAALDQALDGWHLKDLVDGAEPGKTAPAATSPAATSMAPTSMAAGAGAPRRDAPAAAATSHERAS